MNNNEQIVLSTSSIIEEGRELTDQEKAFCEWYTGVRMSEDGSATELDIILSALKAGYNNSDAQKMVSRVRKCPNLQMYIATLNSGRKGETMSKIEAYARRAIDVASDIMENSVEEKLRLQAAKQLMTIGMVGVKGPDEDKSEEMRRANEEVKERLKMIQEKLSTSQVTYQKYEPVEVIEDGKDDPIAQ